MFSLFSNEVYYSKLIINNYFDKLINDNLLKYEYNTTSNNITINDHNKNDFKDSFLECLNVIISKLKNKDFNFENIKFFSNIKNNNYNYDDNDDKKLSKGNVDIEFIQGLILKLQISLNTSNYYFNNRFEDFKFKINNVIIFKTNKPVDSTFLKSSKLNKVSLETSNFNFTKQEKEEKEDKDVIIEFLENEIDLNENNLILVIGSSLSKDFQEILFNYKSIFFCEYINWLDYQVNTIFNE